MISARRLSITCRGRSVIDDVSFDVAAGECVGVSGPSGSGKTTLLQTFAGLVKPTAGSIHLQGDARPADGFLLRRRVAYGASDALVGDGLRVDEYLRFVAQVRTPRGVVEASAGVAAARRAGLDPAAAIVTLTPAQRAALAIAAALVTPARVVLIDGAVDALAPCQLERVISWLLEIRDRDVAMLVTTNDAEAQNSLCHRVLQLAHGSVAEQWRPEAATSGLGSHAEPPVRTP
jgi:ABC-type multidrug transport system ATPase subunit